MRNEPNISERMLLDMSKEIVLLREENAALREAARQLLAQMPPAVFKSTPETPLSLWGVEPTVADAIALHDAFYIGKE